MEEIRKELKQVLTDMADTLIKRVETIYGTHPVQSFDDYQAMDVYINAVLSSLYANRDAISE